MVERGVAGVMRHLGMRGDGPDPVATPMLIERSDVLRAGQTGLFYPAVAKAQHVEQGQVLGRITNFHGAPLEEVRAPFAGEVLYVIGTPPITKGEPVAMIGAVK